MAAVPSNPSEEFFYNLLLAQYITNAYTFTGMISPYGDPVLDYPLYKGSLDAIWARFPQMPY